MDVGLLDTTHHYCQYYERYKFNAWKCFRFVWNTISHVPPESPRTPVQNRWHRPFMKSKTTIIHSVSQAPKLPSMFIKVFVIMMWSAAGRQSKDVCTTHFKHEAPTCTCGGVPRTYTTASAMSFDCRYGLFSKNCNISFGTPAACIPSVFVYPGLRLCKHDTETHSQLYNLLTQKYLIPVAANVLNTTDNAQNNNYDYDNTASSEAFRLGCVTYFF